MSDDREFDRMLEDELSALPPPDGAVREVTPWRRAMGRVVWGIGLTTVTVSALWLDYILPAVGTALLVLGFRTLRRENRWLTACWALSLWDAALFFLGCVWDATVWPDPPAVLGWARHLILLALAFCLWQGVRAVRRAAGQPPRAGAAGALTLFLTVLCIPTLLTGVEVRLTGLLLVLPILVLYLCILRCLARLPALLDGVGYTVHVAPVRLPDGAVKALWAAALVAGVLLAGALFCRYPMEWAPVEAGEQAGLEEVRGDLLALGMPEQVLDDLAPDDLAGLDGALSVTVRATEEFFSGAPMTREEQLLLTNVAVELPGGHWRIIHHFLWLDSPELRTTECMELWPAWRDREEWRQEGALTGRLLFDRQGTTYAGDYYSLSTVRYTANDFFNGPTETSSPFALFSLPARGENCRGYVVYGARALEEVTLLNAWVNYDHQMEPFRYPAMTALEHAMAGMGGGSWGDPFGRAQSAIQLFLGED